MKEYLDILNTELKKVTLSTSERASMRHTLTTYMDEHPVHVPRVRSRSKKSSRVFFGFAIPSPFVSLVQRTSLVSLVVVLALVLSGSVSFAAEAALPGDTLYPVKTNINENVQSFFALSSQSQAELQVRFTGRRLEEAEQLAVAGKLNDDTRKELGQKISEHTTDFKKQFTQMVNNKNYAKAVATASEFESTLQAHQNVLAVIESATSSDEQSVSDATNTDSVSGQVQLSLAVARDSRVIAEDKLSADTTPDVQLSAATSLESVEQTISDTRTYLAQIKDKISPASYADLDARVVSSEQQVALGKTKIGSNQYGDAFILFQDALRNAKETKVALETSAKLALQPDKIIAVSSITGTSTPVICATSDDCQVGFICSNGISFTVASTTATTSATTTALTMATTTTATSTISIVSGDATSTVATSTTIVSSDATPVALCIPSVTSLLPVGSSATSTVATSTDTTATSTATTTVAQ